MEEEERKIYKDEEGKNIGGYTEGEKYVGRGKIGYVERNGMVVVVVVVVVKQRKHRWREGNRKKRKKQNE